jgi:hypothetical protein
MALLSWGESFNSSNHDRGVSQDQFDRNGWSRFLPGDIYSAAFSAK